MGTKWDVDKKTYVCLYKVILSIELTEKINWLSNDKI